MANTSRPSVPGCITVRPLGSLTTPPASTAVGLVPRKPPPDLLEPFAGSVTRQRRDSQLQLLHHDVSSLPTSDDRLHVLENARAPAGAAREGTSRYVTTNTIRCLPVVRARSAVRSSEAVSASSASSMAMTTVRCLATRSSSCATSVHLVERCSAPAAGSPASSSGDAAAGSARRSPRRTGIHGHRAGALHPMAAALQDQRAVACSAARELVQQARFPGARQPVDEDHRAASPLRSPQRAAERCDLRRPSHQGGRPPASSGSTKPGVRRA